MSDSFTQWGVALGHCGEEVFTSFDQLPLDSLEDLLLISTVGELASMSRLVNAISSSYLGTLHSLRDND